MKPEPFVDVDLPNDEELERLTRYVGGYMSAEEVELFDRQLDEDREFFYRMAPMIDLWETPEVLPIEVEVLKELDALRQQKAARALRLVPASRPTRPTRWRPLVGFGGLAIAAEVLLTFVSVGTQSVPEMARMVAHTPPRDSVPTVTAPAVRPPAVTVKHTLPRRHTAPTVIASVEPEQIAPHAYTADSATERMAAAMDSTQAAAAFIAAGRVADTLDAAALRAIPMSVASRVDTSSFTKIGWSTGTGAGAAPGSQSSGQSTGLWGVTKRIVGGLVNLITGRKK